MSGTVRMRLRACRADHCNQLGKSDDTRILTPQAIPLDNWRNGNSMINYAMILTLQKFWLVRDRIKDIERNISRFRQSYSQGQPLQNRSPILMNP